MAAFRATYCVIHYLGLSLMLAALLTPAWAQVPTAITSDGSLGTTVTQDGNVFEITDGTRQGRNLFHSFDRFDVGTGDIARFTGPTNIENILNRVTGGQPSMIDGMLQSDIAGANFYLLNPSGVILGANATLDVQGSFHVSTADVLRFDDGARFSADLGGQSMLTVATPVAFGFLQTQPVGIRIAGSHLQVPEGETLSVVGGNMEVTGDAASASFEAPTLSAPGGRIDLVSVGSSGDVVLSSSGPSPNPGVDSFEHLGKMTISDGALVDVSSEAGGGTVVIRGGRLRVDNSRIFADTLGDVDGATTGIDMQVVEDVVLTNGTLITTDALGAGAAGDIRVRATSIDVTTGAVLGSSPFPGSTGQGGNVEIRVGVLKVDERGQILTFTFGSGQGGNVVVEAQTVRLADEAQISSNTSGAGKAGMVTVTADTVSLTVNDIDPFFFGGSINSNTFGAGNAGTVTVMADSISLTGVGSSISSAAADRSSGQSGNVVVEAQTVRLAGGAQISSNTSGSGEGGMVTVTADTVSLTVNDIDALGGSISSNTFGAGNAGTVTVMADSISLTGVGSFISSAAADRSSGNAGMVTVTADTVFITANGFISNSTFGEGEAGTVTVTADTVSLTSGGSITSDAAGESSGNAGMVTVTANTVSLTNGSEIRSNTSPDTSGNGGLVTIVADTVSLMDLSSISSDAIGDGNPGMVTVMADTLSLTNASKIRNTTTSDNSPGNITGMVRIIADTVSLENGSSIDSETSGSGDGGLITVIANSVSLTDFSEIDSDSFSGASGDPGTVTVMADTVSLTNGSEISSEILSGTGDAGDVMIHAREALTIRGGSQISSLTSGAGNAGSITLNVGQLLADGGSMITSANRGATGKAGTVTIQGPSGPGTMARLITLSSAGVETRSNGAEGGNIVVAAGTVELTQGARITAESSGEGNAGTITITAADTFLSEDSSVTTEARQAQGGEIRIAAQSMVRLRNTQVTTEVEGGDERAGNIIIDPDFVIVENSQLVTRAEGGPGGDIRISAEAAVLINPDSVVDASSAQNIDGAIDIQAPVSNLSSSLSPLPQRFLNAQLRSQCAERWRGGSVSRLVESGRDGLPARPGTLLLSPLTEIIHQTDEAKERLSETSSANVGQRRMGNHGYAHLGFLQTLWHVDCAS